AASRDQAAKQADEPGQCLADPIGIMGRSWFAASPLACRPAGPAARLALLRWRPIGLPDLRLPTAVEPREPLACLRRFRAVGELVDGLAIKLHSRLDVAVCFCAATRVQQLKRRKLRRSL